MIRPLDGEPYGTLLIAMSSLSVESDEIDMLSLTTKRRAWAFAFGTAGAGGGNGSGGGSGNGG